MLAEATARPSSSLEARVRRGAMWSGLNTLVLRVANIAFMAIVVRIVSPHEFGVFAIAITVHAVVSSVGELGVASVLTRGDTDPDKIAPTVATIAMASATALAVAMYTLSPSLSAALGSADAAGAMRVMSLAVLLVGVFTVPGALLAREFRQERIFRANVIAFVPSNVLLIALAVHGDGALAFAWSRVLGQLIMGAVMALSVSKRYKFGFAPSQLRFVLGFGLPLAGANLINYTLLNADYAFVGRMLGAVELGLYMLAFNVANWSSSLLAAMVNGVGMPAFSRLKSKPVELASALLRANRAVALVAWPIAALTVASAQPLIETIYGHTWAAAAPVLAILGVYGVMFIHSLVFANMLVGTGHARALLVVQALWLVMLIPAMAVGQHLSGIKGVAAAHAVVICTVVIPAYVIAIRRLAGVRPRGVAAAVAPAAVAAFVAGLIDVAMTAAVPTSALRLLVGGSCGAAAYLLLAAPELRSLLPDAEGGTRSVAARGLELVSRPQLRVTARWRRAPGRHRLHGRRARLALWQGVA